SDITFSNFLNLPTGGAYNYRNSTFTPPSGGPTTNAVYRIAFTDGAKHRWVVYYPAGSSAFQIPTPPAGSCPTGACVDRTIGGDTARSCASNCTDTGSDYLLAVMQVDSTIGDTD